MKRMGYDDTVVPFWDEFGNSLVVTPAAQRFTYPPIRYDLRLVMSPPALSPPSASRPVEYRNAVYRLLAAQKAWWRR